MEISLISAAGFEFSLRWVHYLAGVTWIGILYYFNFIQGEWFKEIDANVKGTAIRTLVPRALWWFRWGAMFTFLSGLAILMYRAHGAGSQFVDLFTTSWGIMILTGALLGTLMFLNVWLIIWPNQKIVIASANGVAEGKEALPEAAGALAKAGLASRTNTLFSIPMLFFMGAASHLGLSGQAAASLTTMTIALLVVIGGLELNAIKGKMGPMASVKGVIASGFILTAVLYGIIEYLG